jgi:hypothetical protein
MEYFSGFSIMCHRIPFYLFRVADVQKSHIFASFASKPEHWYAIATLPPPPA